MTTISRRVLLQTLASAGLAVETSRAQSAAARRTSPVPAGATTHEWPSGLGPTHTAVSTGTHLAPAFPPP